MQEVVITKDIFKPLREFETKISIKKAELKGLTDINATSITDNPTFGSGTSDKTSELAIKTIELREVIEEMGEKYVVMQSDAIKLAKNINNVHIRAVIIFRYISFMKFEDIADKMNYELSYIYKLHRKGCEIVQRIHNQSNK